MMLMKMNMTLIIPMLVMRTSELEETDSTSIYCCCSATDNKRYLFDSQQYVLNQRKD